MRHTKRNKKTKLNDPLASFCWLDDVVIRYYGTDEYDNDWSGIASGYDCDIVESVLNEDGQRIQVVNLNQENGEVVNKEYQTFNSIKFRDSLSKGILHFVYKKVNGETRNAFGTTNIRVLRQNHAKIEFTGRYKIGDNIRYYDMNSRAWRCFKPNNLIRIINKINVEENQ